MVRIRLRRVGARHQPSFRIVAADKESPRDGRFLEIIGHYNPRTEPATIKIKEDRLYHWLKNGAQPSESVAQLMRTSGAQERWERFKAGESLETLLAEAAAMEVEIDPRTRRDDLAQASKKAPKPAGAEAEVKAASEKAEKTEAAAEEAVVPEEAATPEVEVAAEVEASEEAAPAEEEPAAPEVEVPAEVEASEEAAPTEEEPAAEEEAPDAEE